MKTPATLLLGLCLAGSPLAAQERIDIRRPAPADGVVVIHNLAGSVRVAGWDRPEVEVTGTLGRGAERVDVESDGTVTQIRVVLPERSHRAASTRLEVRVPVRSRLDVRTVSAGIEVSDVAGAVELGTTSGAIAVSGSPASVGAESISGSIRLAAGAAPVRAKSVSGSIRVGGAPSSVSVESVSGSVDVESAPGGARATTVSGDIVLRGVGQRVDATTHSGNMRVTAAVLQDARLHTLSGDLEFSGDIAPAGAATFHSHSGTVRLLVSRALAAEFAIQTFSGRIRNELEGQMLVSDRNRVRFVTAGGGARIAVNTFSGTVEILPR